MRRRQWLLSCLALATGCVRSPTLELVVASDLTLGRDWQEVKSRPMMRTTSAWSHLVLEIPATMPRDARGRPRFHDGTPIEVEGYLTTATDERLVFDKGSFATFGGHTVVLLSSPELQWRSNDRTFVRVSLKANRDLKVGKIIWMSYDPRTTHDGFLPPRSVGR